MNEKPAPEWDEIHGLRGTDFGDLASTAVTLASTINALEEELKPIKAQLLDHMKRAQQESVRYGATRVTLVAGKKPSRSLDETKLLKNGVKMSVIEKSYTEGKPGSPYVKLTTRVDEG